jgi:DNA-binding transcriptional ArsR family regulator
MDTIEIQGEEVNVSDMAERLAPYGNVENGLRKSRPTSESGLAQYVWRMARFHSGKDTHMPVTCEFWLSSWMEERGMIPTIRESTSSRDRRSKITEATKEIEPLVTSVLEEFGLDDTKAASRWSKAGLL